MTHEKARTLQISIGDEFVQCIEGDALHFGFGRNLAREFEGEEVLIRLCIVRRSGLTRSVFRLQEIENLR
jgi:hypothetical protein